MEKKMNKPLLTVTLALTIFLQPPQISYSQESDSKVCIGDCMVYWSEGMPDIQDVYFDKDGYTLDETDQDILKKNAGYLMTNKNVHMEIQGHCDERGNNLENLELGDKRADSVKKYLISLGADRKRLHTISYGEEKPFCMQSNEECWKLNNRVHFMISK